MTTSPVGYYRLGASAPRTGTREGYPRRRARRRVLSGVFLFAKSASVAVVIGRSASTVAAHVASASNTVIVAATASTTVSYVESASDSVIVAATAAATASHVASASDALVVAVTAAAVAAYPELPSDAVIFAASAAASVGHPVAASRSLIVSVSADSQSVLPRSLNPSLVFTPVAVAITAHTKDASSSLVATAAATASSLRSGVAGVTIFLSPVGPVTKLRMRSSDPAPLVVSASAMAVGAHHRSSRLPLIFGVRAVAGLRHTKAASASFRLRVDARFVGPPNARGVNYLGRFQLGQDVPLRLEAVIEDGGTEVTPEAAPEVLVYRDAVAVRSLLLPFDSSDGGAPGRFRGRYTLGPKDGVGRYAVVYLYGLSRKTRGAVDVFEVVPGGDANGPIIATYSLGRPDGDVVLAHLGSGKLVAAQGPYIDEGL